MPKRRAFTHPWQFRGLTTFPRDPEFRVGTTPPPWDSWMACPWFRRKPLTEDDLERQRDKIRRTPLVVRDRQYPFREDVIPDASRNTDPQLPVLAKDSSLVDVLQLGGSYDLIERLWERFVLTASRVNVSVASLPNEVLVSSVFSAEHLGRHLVTSLITHLFSQSFSMQCFDAFWTGLLSG